MNMPLPTTSPTPAAAGRPPKEKRPRRPRDSLEDLLVDIWVAAFGVEQVGIDDDFQAIGGDAARADAIAAAIADACDISLTGADVMRAATVRALALYVKECARPVISQRCRSFPARPAALPFFFVHGDPNGGGLYCKGLAGALGADIALHALTPLGPFGPAPLRDVEAMAAFHIETLQAIQPHGPYTLGGFCLGGVVSLAMAHQLLARGQEVRRVVLVAPKVWSRYYGLRRLLLWVGRRLKLFRPYDAAAFLWVIENIQPMFTWWDRQRALRRGIPPERFRGMRPLRDIANPRKRATRRGSMDAQESSHRPAGDVAEQRRAEFSAELVRVARLHVPHPWPGRLIVLRPEHDDFMRLAEPETSWRQIARDLEVHTIPGGHTNCVATHVRATGRRIAACLFGGH